MTMKKKKISMTVQFVEKVIKGMIMAKTFQGIQRAMVNQTLEMEVKSRTTVITDELVQKIFSDVKMVIVCGINLSVMGTIIVRITAMTQNLCDGRTGCGDWSDEIVNPSLRRPSFEMESM